LEKEEERNLSAVEILGRLLLNRYLLTDRPQQEQAQTQLKDIQEFHNNAQGTSHLLVH